MLGPCHATKSKRFPAGVLAACSASRAARFGSDAGKNPGGWHGEDQETMRRDRRSEDCVVEPRRSHPAGVICGKEKEGAQRRVAVPRQLRGHSMQDARDFEDSAMC